MPATLDEYAAAVETLGEEDFTAGGKPKVEPLNDALETAGAEAVSAAERDELDEAHHAAISAADATDAINEFLEEKVGEADTDDDSRLVEITVNQADSSPVNMHIGGVGSCQFPIGEVVTAPAVYITALIEGGCQITWKEIDNA